MPKTMKLMLLCSVLVMALNGFTYAEIKKSDEAEASKRLVAKITDQDVVILARYNNETESVEIFDPIKGKIDELISLSLASAGNMYKGTNQIFLCACTFYFENGTGELLGRSMIILPVKDGLIETKSEGINITVSILEIKKAILNIGR